MNRTGLPLPDFSAMHSYSLYGVTVRSGYPLPLSTVMGQPDITIYFDGIVDRKPGDVSTNPNGRVWQRSGEDWLLKYYGCLGHMTQFLISADGRLIRISQSWPEWRDTLFALMNPAMAAALLHQNYPVLHASSLVFRDGSFLVMGDSGSGKSTLSAALATSGLAVHSDDIAVLNKGYVNGKYGQPPVVGAGYPRIKVHPGLPGRLGLPEASLLPLFCPVQLDEVAIECHDNVNEQELWLPADQLPGGFHDRQAALKGIFILTERISNREAPRVELLNQMDATMELVGHVYGREWLQPPDFNILSLCTRLSGSIPVFRVALPDDLTRLTFSARLLIDEYILPLSEPAAPAIS